MAWPIVVAVGAVAAGAAAAAYFSSSSEKKPEQGNSAEKGEYKPGRPWAGVSTIPQVDASRFGGTWALQNRRTQP